MLLQHLLLLSSLLSLASSAVVVVVPRDHPAEPEETASIVAGCEGEAACGAAVESTAAAEGGEATATYEAATTATATAYETAAPAAEETAEVVETTEEGGGYETASPTYEAEPAYETTAAAYTTAEVKYGSGSHDWNGFNACIDKCQAQFAPPGEATYAYPAATATATEAPPAPAEMTPPPAEGEAATKTHTVIVAPTKGVLRYVPFAISAAPGDVIEYVWGAGPHTATEGSQDGICNKTEGGFNSGLMNASATFPETVNDTSTKLVYCSVPTHCQKGMFAVINPPEVPSNVTIPTNTSLAEMLPPMLESNPSLNTKYELAKTACANSTAWTWGDNFEMGGMEAWAMEPAVENILYTRMSYAMNPAAQIDGFNVASFVVPPALDGSSPGGEVVSMSMPVGSSSTAAASASAASVSVAGGASGAQATGDAQSASQSSIPGGAHSTTKLSITLLVSVASLVSFFALA